jgi:hypothetical protein
MRGRWCLGILTLAAGASLAPNAAAETVDCRRVTRLPATLARPGLYCLVGDLATSSATGAAITVEADDVVLDLNGWTLDGSAAGSSTEAVGIRSVDRSNVTVKNGTVRGFRTGVLIFGLPATGGHVVEGIRADRNTGEGLSVAGRGAHIRRNQVLHTGGSTAPLTTRAFGIVVNAPEGVVADNLVVGVTAAPGSFSYGIHATRSDGLVIEGNQVVNETLSPGTTFGIIIPFSQDVLVVNNRVTRTSEGVTYSSGATGKYRDNLTSGVAIPYNGTGTDAGNNN